MGNGYPMLSRCQLAPLPLRWQSLLFDESLRLKKNNLPRHVALIMDGNCRAKSRRMPRFLVTVMGGNAGRSQHRRSRVPSSLSMLSAENQNRPRMKNLSDEILEEFLKKEPAR